MIYIHREFAPPYGRYGGMANGSTEPYFDEGGMVIATPPYPHLQIFIFAFYLRVGHT